MSKRVLRNSVGIILILTGLFLFFLKPLGNLTGFAINETIQQIQGIWLYAFGLGLMIIGFILLSYQTGFDYSKREQKLKEILEERYDRLSEADKIANNKSYRKHLEKIQRQEKEIDTGETSDGGYRIIRTKRFMRDIRRHDPDIIQRAIEKIGTGLANEERLKGRDDWSIRTTQAGRIIFDRDEGTKTAKLKRYTPSHEYDRV
jgi:hypothetical protein